ncbi:MAG: ferredoxin family protein [Candidatus Competibacteraceae bacterium]
MNAPIHGDNKLDAGARATALQAVAGVAVESTSLVSYRSQGRLLLIGSADQTLALATELKNRSLRCHVLAWGGGIDQASDDVPTLVIRRAQPVRISGHLGQFTVTLPSEGNDINIAQAIGSDSAHFDLILDLDTPPHLQWETPPLGYFAPDGDAGELNRALTELPEFVGEFEKATFFEYDPDICAHGARGLKGCTRCLDSCPTGAITSIGNQVAIDPYTCQGGGSCATACPTGAIIYSFPRPADTLNRLRLLLKTYATSAASAAILVFHDGEAGAARLAAVMTLPDNIIPIEVEEIGSVGMDIWLAALAYGASAACCYWRPYCDPQRVSGTARTTEFRPNPVTRHGLFASCAGFA